MGSSVISGADNTYVHAIADAYDTYMSLTGATEDSSTGLLKISQADYDNLESLFFEIGDTTYEFTANAQTWPRSVSLHSRQMYVRADRARAPHSSSTRTLAATRTAST